MHVLTTFAALLTLSSAALVPRQGDTTLISEETGSSGSTGSTDSTSSSGSDGACNNSPDLCSKAYNEITHLGAHDSPFVRDATTDFSVSGNQFYNSTIQLNAGVRLLSGQIHLSNGDLHLCHSSCDLLDAGLLSTWLMEIKQWLDNNPREVVTILIVNADDSSPQDISAHFEAANATEHAYVPADKARPPTTWPTLNDLISANTRLMTFVASIPPETIPSNMTYLMDEFTFIFENDFENTRMDQFSCDPHRPTAVQNNSAGAISSNRMALMNHFLYKESELFNIQSPNIDNITITNSPDTNQTGMLGRAIETCTSEYGGNPPTFVLVDFFDEGPSIEAVDEANGIQPVSRTAVPARDHNSDEGSLSARTFAGVKELVKQVEMGQKPRLGEWIWAGGQWIGGGLNTNGGLSIG